MNDTQCGLLERVRQDWFHTVSSSDAGDNDCSVADDDEQGSWRSDFLTKEIQENVRTLRPRSRKRYGLDNLSCAKCLLVFLLVICFTLTLLITLLSGPDCHLFWFLCILLLSSGLSSDHTHLMRLYCSISQK